MCRSGRGAVHEGGRLAERPHGAISNRQPFSGTPARRDFQSPASHLTPADGATSTKVDARRHARAARFPIASPSSMHPAGQEEE